MRLPLILTIAAACLLHAYTWTFKAQDGWSLFTVCLFAFSLTPYAISAFMGRVWHALNAALGFAAGALAGDIFMHYAVFIAPKGSTAALGLLFMPVWNLLLLGPLGAVIGWACARAVTRRRGENAA
ncbi:hypothetical protein [uncultured Ramlibacter sp.]|uniref:hypothetical protein n=1 Tax=uncultured Ramlibacter sp. TaxID=260755 RepID=UPI002604AA64|nr:hypothetical protein [uncultured Ramlibacter sp.]